MNPHGSGAYLLRSTCALLALVSILSPSVVHTASPINTPLQTLASNPRFLTDGTGKAVYLAGINGWQTFEDFNTTSPPPAYNWVADLDEATTNGYNFIRLWLVEQEAWGDSDQAPGTLGLYGRPLPWTQVGSRSVADPGVTQVGIYDLHSFNQAFFDRLRTRVQAAQQRGIYVSVMLFSGGHLGYFTRGWFSHPFNSANNVNGIDGDKNADGKGLETHTLADPAIVAIQEAYLKKIVDTVNDLPNVIYEISNEDYATSVAWQNHMADLIRQMESQRARHPVWISAWQDMLHNEHVFAMRADIVGPNNSSDDYDNSPPASTGEKVVFADSDHMGTETPQWPWKIFLRGAYAVFLDERETPSVRAAIKKAMGQTIAYSKRIDLATMSPAKDTVVCSTGYCLMKPGAEYLMYLPAGGPATINLSGITGNFSVEYLHQGTGQAASGETVSGGSTRSFFPPFSEEAVVHVKALATDIIPPAPPTDVRAN